MALRVVDELSVDVLIGTEDRQAGLAGRAGNRRPNAPAELLPALFFLSERHLLFCFTGSPAWDGYRSFVVMLIGR